MKKLLLLTITMMLCFCNVAFAQNLNVVEEILMYRRTDVSYNTYLAAHDNAMKLLTKSERTMTFKAGDTSVKLKVPLSVDTSILTADATTTLLNRDKLEIAKFLDAKYFAEYLETVKENDSTVDFEKKKSELSNIANQIRGLYARIRLGYIYYDEDGSMTVDTGWQDTTTQIGPNMPGLSTKYVLKDGYRTISGTLQDLSWGIGKLLFWEDMNGNAVLVYDENIWDNNTLDGLEMAELLEELEKGPGTRVTRNDAYYDNLEGGLTSISSLLEDEQLIKYINEHLVNSEDPEERILGTLALETINHWKGKSGGGDNVIGSSASGEFEDAVDMHHYKSGSILPNLGARSAEYKVLSQCWGGCESVDLTPIEAGSAEITFNMNVVPDNEKLEGPVAFEVKFEGATFKQNFMLRYYYAQDVPIQAYTGAGNETDEIISILTDYNIEHYFKRNVVSWANRAFPDYYIKQGKKDVKVDQSAKRAAAVDVVLTEARNFPLKLNGGGYARIGVITEGYKEKDFFIFEPNLYNLGQTVFAQAPANGGKPGILVGLKTSAYNDIYRQDWYEPVPDATDINWSALSPYQLNKMQYRLKDTSYYLCEECATCDECGELVASGPDKNEIGQYFSHYCGAHACRFVWVWEADPNNPGGGSKKEGLKCQERMLYGIGYCADHKCNTCYAPIVGVSQYHDADGVADMRATGSENRSLYSNYCADHKCRYVGCQNNRTGGQSTSGNTSDVSRVISPLYCNEHNSVCSHCGKNPVTADDYEAAGDRMICTSCREEAQGVANSNNQPPVHGKCAICGEMKNIYMGGRTCQSCNAEKLFPLASLIELDLSTAIKADQANRGIDGEGKISKYDGLKGTLYNPDGTIKYKDAAISMYRSQGRGLELFEKHDGTWHLGYTANCTDSAVLTMALTVKLGGGTMYIKDGKELDVDLYTFGTKDENGNEKKYLVPQLSNGKVNCIWWGKMADIVYGGDGYTATPALTGASLGNEMSAENKLAYMNNSRIIGVGGWSHTFKNTGLPISYTIDGTSYDGYIYSNFGLGSGIGNDTYANDYKSFFVKNGQLWYVPLVTGKDGNLKIDADKAKKYNAKDFSVFGYSEAFGNVG